MTQSSFLGKEKIGKLLLKQSVPATIGMLVMSLYFLVDTIFIGHAVGPLGIAGISITFPLHMIVMGVSLMMGIGMSSIISRALGAKEFKKAEQSLGNYISFTGISGILLTILMYIFLEPLLKIIGATEGILPFAKTYMSIILISNLFLIYGASGNAIIRSVGKAKTAMILMLSSALINLILDYIFIFIFDWGISGAAWATVISQVIMGSIAFYIIISGKIGVKFYFKFLKFSKKIIYEACLIGSSTFARQMVASLFVGILNFSLGFYGGDLGVAAFGVANRIYMFILMPTYGIVQGLMPIVGYNFGAKKFKRVKHAINLSVLSSTIFMFISFILVMFFAESFAKVFTTDIDLINYVAFGQRIMFLLIFTMGFQTIIGSVFQSMGKPKPAFILSIIKYIFLLPFVLILPLFFGFKGIWYAYPIADILSTIVVIFVYKYELKLISKDL